MESSKDLQPSARSHDFSVENLMFLSTLQLAQSQYCFFKKADGAKMSSQVMAKISKQLYSFFADTEKYAKTSPVLKKSAHLQTIGFYKSYYHGLAVYHKGMELRAEAEGKGEGMGISGAMIAWAMKLLGASAKLADSATASAVETRLGTMKVEYEELQLQMKNVYYESNSSQKDAEAVAIDSKNFTLYRSIEADLSAEYAHASAYACFQPMAVRQLEGELQTQANEIMNKNIEQI